MKPIQFYALKNDLLGVLEAVEADAVLKYVRTGNRTSDLFETFDRGRDIPCLGQATSGTGSTCESFLVSETRQLLITRPIGAPDAQRYCMDQLANPNTIVLTPAGAWGEETILQGVLATVSDSPVARTLMKRFVRVFRKVFEEVDGRLVGPDAMTQFRHGKRLTISAQSPPEFDLAARP